MARWKIRRKFSALLVLTLSITFLVLLLSSFFDKSQLDVDVGPDVVSDRAVVPIDPVVRSQRMDSVEWKSSADIRLRASRPETKPVTTVTEKEFLPFALSGPESLAETASSAVIAPPASEQSLSIRHHPSRILPTESLPSTLRGDSASTWRLAEPISTVHVVEARKRIAQGEKIFKRAPNNSPRVLDHARGRNVLDRSGLDRIPREQAGTR